MQDISPETIAKIATRLYHESSPTQISAPHENQVPSDVPAQVLLSLGGKLPACGRCSLPIFGSHKSAAGTYLPFASLRFPSGV